MTFTKDKLPAISVFARLYGAETQYSYIAGQWLYRNEDLSDLQQIMNPCGQVGCSLSWYRASPLAGEEHYRRTNTFSWISIKEAVKYSLCSESFSSDSPIRITSWSASLRNIHDPYGEVEPCSLTLSGYLKRAKLSSHTCRCGESRLAVTTDIPGSYIQDIIG